jgi:hypothetical protein
MLQKIFTILTKQDYSLNACRTKRTVVATRNVTAEIKVKIDFQWWYTVIWPITTRLSSLLLAKSKSRGVLKSLPVQYFANKRAWMTSVLFETWLLKLEARFKAENRNLIKSFYVSLLHKETITNEVFAAYHKISNFIFN